MIETNFVWCKITRLFWPWLGAALAFDTSWSNFNFCMWEKNLSFFINFAFCDYKFYKLWNKMMETNFVWCKVTPLFWPWVSAPLAFDTTWSKFNFCMWNTKCFSFLHKFCILRQQILQVVKQNDGNEFCLMQNHYIVLALAWRTSGFRHNRI